MQMDTSQPPRGAAMVAHKAGRPLLMVAGINTLMVQAIPQKIPQVGGTITIWTGGAAAAPGDIIGGLGVGAATITITTTIVGGLVIDDDSITGVSFFSSPSLMHSRFNVFQGAQEVSEGSEVASRMVGPWIVI